VRTGRVVGRSGAGGAGARLGLCGLVLLLCLGAGERRGAQTPGQRTPAVGPYRLNAEVSGLAGLQEMTVQEVDAMRPPTRFQGERYYRAPTAVFAGVTWDLIVAAVDGKLFKISGLYAPQSDDLDVRWRQLGAAVQRALGPPKVFHDGAVLLWDMADGNLLLHREKGGFVTMLLLSWATQGFTRTR
jgi:hypothetical protein